MTVLLSILSRFWPHLIAFALGAWAAAAVQEIRIERLQDRRAMRERVLAAWRGGH